MGKGLKTHLPPPIFACLPVFLGCKTQSMPSVGGHSLPLFLSVSLRETKSKLIENQNQNSNQNWFTADTSLSSADTIWILYRLPNQSNFSRINGISTLYLPLSQNWIIGALFKSKLFWKLHTKKNLFSAQCAQCAYCFLCETRLKCKQPKYNFHLISHTLI